MNPRNTCALLSLTVVAGAIQVVAQDPLPTAGIESLANSEIGLQLTTSAGHYYRWDASEQLVQWEPLVTWLSTGLNSHTDSAAPYHPSRFYAAVELSTAPPLTGDQLATPDGSVIIHPINHASLVLEWKGTIIYVDPVGGATPFQDLPRADLILVTHGHGDHLHTGTIDSVRGANAAIVATPAVHSSLPAAQKALTTVLTNGASAPVKGIPIDAVPAYNLTTTHHPKGVGNGYILTLGGKRIYIAGDTEDTPELRALRNIDVAFLPVNQPYTMTVAKAADAIREFRPKVVYPYHYRNATGAHSDLNALKTQVGADLGIEVRLRNWY